MKTIQRLRLDSFLSFPLVPRPSTWSPLNVLIGPNGSGKSNVIEAIELLHATPTNLAAAIRDGGGAEEWLWKGRDHGPEQAATIDVELGAGTPTGRPLRYRLEFTSVQGRTEVLDEAIEEASADQLGEDAFNCIEEPELGLHPDTAALLVDLLVEASERMQLIVTTHSDALISELTNQPEAVITCERPGEGTILNRLDPERLRSWLDEYSPRRPVANGRTGSQSLKYGGSIMNDETQHWGSHVLGNAVVGSSPPRISLEKELPDTRIFVDKLFHEYVASGRRLETERIVRSKDKLPWLPAAQDMDDA